VGYSGSGLSTYALTGVRRDTLRRMVAALYGCSRLVSVTFAAEAQAATYTVGITTDVGGTCTSASGKASLGQLVNDENTSPRGGRIFSWCNRASDEISSTGATNTTTITYSSIAFSNGGIRATTGGGLLASPGKISVQNSIIAANTVTDPLTRRQTPSNSGSSSPGVITARGYSIETAADCGFTATGGLSNAGSGVGCETSPRRW
jgi:hypothetical protein